VSEPWSIKPGLVGLASRNYLKTTRLEHEKLYTVTQALKCTGEHIPNPWVRNSDKERRPRKYRKSEDEDFHNFIGFFPRIYKNTLKYTNCKR
jgi:hypothetical protein